MRTLTAVFALACALALALTPLVRRVATRLELFDATSARKVHHGSIPRLGGVAVYLAFVVPMVLGLVYQGPWTERFTFGVRVPAFLAGATLVFAIGLLDDLFSLGARVKLLGQIAAALLLVTGGAVFTRVSLPFASDVSLGVLAVPATVFWFVLVINAFNLIDGLDGLAAGIALFASLALLGFSVQSGNVVVALGFAALAGATLGFLRYNWNPATIFLGDGGSYLLGYCLAGLSLIAARKSEATVAILTPIIALGVPMMDALWAPVRRFVLGQRLFQPDRDHIHHRLLKLGYTPRRAVLVLYAATIATGALAFAIVHARDDRAALLLALLGASGFVALRRLGYLGFIRRRQIVDWVGSVSDAIGLPQDRRSFLEHQATIADASTPSEMWRGVCSAADFLGLDACELRLFERTRSSGSRDVVFRYESERQAAAKPGANESLHFTLPLVVSGASVGRLVVRRSHADRKAQPFLVRRIDQLHGTIHDALVRIHELPELEDVAERREEALLRTRASRRTLVRAS